MRDPYEVLGISNRATDSEVKTAYRELARKYHPDNYQNNPLADLAKEKMIEINAAYDEIVQMRSAGGSSGGHAGARSSGGYSSSRFNDLRNMINQNRIEEAHRVLDGIPASDRGAEWYFLRGVVLQRKGWLADARMCFNQAVNMEPQNAEYRAASNAMNMTGGGSRDPSYGNGRAMCVPCGGDCCSICATYMCMDCLCNMCSCF